ncbi:MAG: tRNA epoxyqueuosine(34) reductase QueG [Acidimicrobiales bacterium]
MLGVAYATELKAIGRAAGLDAVGIAAARPFGGTRRDLETRRAAGLHGGMAFTYRNPARSTDPARTVPGAASLVVGAHAYPHADPPAPSSRRHRPHGRVAAYAPSDHYAVLRASLGAVAARLRADGWRARVVVDDNALVDREAAYRAGLGWYGKNANLLLPGRGSWFVLGSVITAAPLPADPAPVADGCGSCHRCVDACPTGAIVAAGVIDARRCLAWLLQAPGSFPEELRVALGDRLYGCDECQTACPINRRAEIEAHPEAEDEDGGTFVDALAILAASDDDLIARYGRWYIPRREPRYLRRNALVVLGNVGDGHDPAVRRTMQRYVDDPDPMLREHAQWAARRLHLVGAAR